MKIELERTGAWTWDLSVNGEYVAVVMTRTLSIRSENGAITLDLGEVLLHPVSKEAGERIIARRLTE